MRRNKKKKEFSKTLLIQESVLIWITTLAFLTLAFICVFNGYLGSLPWLTAMAALPWAAYAVSQGCYYSKSKAQNVQGGITYETALRGMEEPVISDDFSQFENFGDEAVEFEDFGPI